MNLLDTASLVVTPNGYKASKLYSIIPSDGSGDMTFARTGDTATRVNSSGLIETVLANKPRLDYTGSTCPKLLLEPQRTNLNLRSQEVDNANYAKEFVTIVANDSISPDGTTTADKVYPTSSGSARQFYCTLSISTSTAYTNTIFAKASGKSWITIFGINGNGSAKFNLSNGTVTGISAGSTATIVSYGNGWYRCSVTETSTSTTGYNGFVLINSDTDNSITANGTDGVYAWGLQVEAGAYATSYIPTTTASVTRNADSCGKTSISSLIGQTEGTIFADFVYSGKFGSTVGAGSMPISIDDGSGNTEAYFIINTSSVLFAQVVNSGSFQSNINGGTLVIGQRYKIAMGYKANDFVFYVNGVQKGTDTSGTVGACSNIRICNYLNNAYPHESINSAVLWKTRLQNSELATLTTL